MKKRTTVKSVVMMGMFVAVLAVMSQLCVPLPSGVPITLQTFAVALTAYVLGAKTGAAAVAVYLLLGAVGVPVFANFQSGIGVLLGAAGGFLWGFLIMAVLCGLAARRKNRGVCAALSAAGLAACHLPGILQFMAVMDMDFVSAAMLASVPFLIKDVISVIAAYAVSLAVRRALNAAGADFLFPCE